MVKRGDVDNQRVTVRPALGSKDTVDGGGIERVGAQAVDGLGRKGNQAAGGDRLGGDGNQLGIGMLGIYLQNNSRGHASPGLNLDSLD